MLFKNMAPTPTFSFIFPSTFPSSPSLLFPLLHLLPSSPSHPKKKGTTKQAERETTKIEEKQFSSISSSSSMAEANSLTHPSKPQSPKAHQNPSKPFSGFLYKVILVSVLIALLPIFPSFQSPESSNKSILARSWELLHLLLAGIAISYGLFSRRNSDPEIENETQLKADTPQSYVSQILQVSSVFDDEEVISPKGLDFTDETKNQTWNYSQYYREEPVVMVAKETTNGTNSSRKPLFLPVRSLKSRPQYPESFDSSYEIDGSSVASNETDEVGKVGKIGGKEGVVLPSPIPWRSRSGRMEVNEETSPPYSPPSSPFDTEFSSSRTPSFRSQTPPYSPPNSAFDAELGPSRTPSFRSSTPRAASRTPSPKRPSPSPSISPEIRGKINEDFGRKKSFYKSSPPPAPPPPPPPPSHGYHFISEKRGSRKSFKDELEDLSRRGRRDGFTQSNDVGSDSFNSEKDLHVARSVRTVRSKDGHSLPPLPKNRRKKKDEFMERMIITASDSESSDDESELSDAEETSNSVPTEAEPEENEVDKKADEFIAKFREQIRLQRIASIKRSSGQRSTRNSK